MTLTTEQRQIIDTVAKDCRFNFWEDEVHIGTLSGNFDNDFAEKMAPEKQPPYEQNTLVLVGGRGFWTEDYDEYYFLSIGTTIAILAVDDWETVMELKDEALTYVEKLRSAKGGGT